MNPESVLVLGNYRQTLVVLRSLTRAGYRTIIGSDAKRVFTQYSRATAEVWRHPDPQREAEFLDALRAFLAQRPDVRWIFPIGEDQVRFCIRHCPLLAPHAMPVMADAASVSLCLDKVALYAAIAPCHVPCAPYRIITDEAGLSSVLGSLGYPAVVRPNSAALSLDGSKAIILDRPEDKAQRLPMWPQGHDMLLVQRYVTGWRHNCHFFAHAGVLHAYFEQRVLRTDRADGTGYGVEGISVAPSAELREHCARLLRHLNYSGIGCVQFLVDAAAKEVSLLEINPRLDATCAAPYHCGYDFPVMALDYARYQRGERAHPPSNDAPYRAGCRNVWLLGDLMAVREAAGSGKISFRTAVKHLTCSLIACARADVHLVWAWDDPLPALYNAAQFIASSIEAVVNRCLAPFV